MSKYQYFEFVFSIDDATLALVASDLGHFGLVTRRLHVPIGRSCDTISMISAPCVLSLSSCLELITKQGWLDELPLSTLIAKFKKKRKKENRTCLWKHGVQIQKEKQKSRTFNFWFTSES